ncbi:MAG: HD-GYP domain-containing protein [Actinobacteria bacterium]|nr:MAG: HD-GYP domain-containing protein [Actinomycetota bacterium]
MADRARVKVLYGFGAVSPATEDSVRRARSQRPEPLGDRLLLTESIFAALFVVAAIALIEIGNPGHVPVGPAIVLTIAFALLSRFEFEVGAGYSIPTQLAFVPMLFVLPPEVAPALVAAGRLLGGLPDFLRRELPFDRVISRLTDCWWSFGPALVLTCAGVDGAHWADWYWWLLALAAQLAFDLAISSAREYFGTGRAPEVHVRELVPTWTLDVLLSPIGLLGALASEQRQYAFVLVFPLALLMWVFAQERHARLDQQIETSRTYRRTALLLGELIGEDDEYTGAHSQGVVSLAVATADELGLGEDQRRLVEFGALLHDVGKIGVPKEIVNKTAALSDDEWEVMRRHTIVGQRMLDRVGGALKDVGQVVRASHERFDGTGYPDGLTGEEIPIAARIVCAADAFSAMTTDRPYRAARDREFAIAELRAQSGRQFDPQVAEATIAMVERYGLPRNRRVIELEAPGLQAPA